MCQARPGQPHGAWHHAAGRYGNGRELGTGGGDVAIGERGVGCAARWGCRDRIEGAGVQCLAKLSR